MQTDTVNVCSWRPSEVTLVDGAVVLSDSEEWRHECEARTILNMPNKPLRVAQLDLTEQRRGRPARERLEAKILEVWEARQKLAAPESASA